MPVSRLPRHAAVEQPRRSTLAPALLLSTIGLAFGGLAVLPSGAVPSLRITAASASSPLVTEIGRPTDAQYDALYAIPDPAATPRPAPARPAERASRSRRTEAGDTGDSSVDGTVPAGTYVRPNNGRITSRFAWRWGRMHNGLDLADTYGTPVRAVTDGVVLDAGWAGGYGLLVKLQHPDGTVTYYGHLSRIVTYSGPVRAGQIIGREGNTGVSTGPHVHFEVRVGGSPVNPLTWLRKHGVAI